MNSNNKSIVESEITRGTIVQCDFQFKDGSSAQAGFRPALVISNNVGNAHSTTLMVAAITTSIKRMDIPTHVVIDDSNCGLAKRSMCMLEQIATIDKAEVISILGSVSDSVMTEIDVAIAISFGLQKKKFIHGKYASVVCLCDECREFIKANDNLVYKRVDPFDKTGGLCQRHNKKGYMYFLYPKNLMER